MNYISPFSFFQLPEGQVPDEKFLAIEKKKHLARLELSEKTFVNIGEKEYSKDDLIKIFQDLAKVTNWEYHSYIHQNKILELFLIDGTWKGVEWKNDSILKEDNFKEFIKPYFVSSYVTYFKKIWANNGYNSFFNFHKQAIPLSQQGLTEAMAKVQDHLYVEAAEIKNLHEDSIYLKHNLRGLPKLYHPERTKILNYLPDSCQEARSNYFRELCHLFCTLHDKLKEKKICSELITSINNAKCDYVTREEINRLYQFHRESILGNGKKGEIGVGRIIFFAIIVIVNLVRICASSSSSSKYDRKYTSLVQDYNYGTSNDYTYGVDYDSYKKNKLGKRDSFLMFAPHSMQQLIEHYSNGTNTGECIKQYNHRKDSLKVIKAFNKALGHEYRENSSKAKYSTSINNNTNSEGIVFLIYSDGSYNIAYIGKEKTYNNIPVSDSVVDLHFYVGKDLCKIKSDSIVAPYTAPHFSTSGYSMGNIKEAFRLNFGRQQMLSVVYPRGTVKRFELSESRFEFSFESSPSYNEALEPAISVKCKVYGNEKAKALTDPGL